MCDKNKQNDDRTLEKYCDETNIIILLPCKILLKINLASKILQSPGVDIGKTANSIKKKNILKNVGKLRDNFTVFIEEVNSNALQWNVTP